MLTAAEDKLLCDEEFMGMPAANRQKQARLKLRERPSVTGSITSDIVSAAQCFDRLLDALCEPDDTPS